MARDTAIARPRVAVGRVVDHKASFFAVFCIMFVVLTIVLGKLDLLPETELATSVAGEIGGHEDPVRVVIKRVGVDALIANPITTNIETLDAHLLSGAVRYPTSAKLGETGNVVLFAHSSYLPVVGNQAYKTFNGIQKLVAGDTITVYSASTAYIYKVRTVEQESAAGDAGIPLNVSGKVLTLSTCDSFGKKTDRFVVVADFVESHSIVS